MYKTLSDFMERRASAIKYWWLLLLLGIALSGAGVLILIKPSEHYCGLAVVFGILMTISGLVEIIVTALNKNYLPSRRWVFASGTLQVMLGGLLLCNLRLSVVLLPILLALWLLVKGYAIIIWTGYMKLLGLPGQGWTIFFGLLLLLFSIWLLIKPLFFGTAILIVWVGVPWTIAGIATCMISLQVRQKHRHVF